MGQKNNVASSDPEELIDDYVNSDSQFKDSFQTGEQKTRDGLVTVLLKKYVDAYSNKISTQKRYRAVLLLLSASIIVLFSIAFLVLLLRSCFWPSQSHPESVVTLVSACVTFLVSVLGLTQVIAKYCFPENDEAYISKIVESIQNNDLQHKIANMRWNIEDNNDK